MRTSRTVYMNFPSTAEQGDGPGWWMAMLLGAIATGRPAQNCPEPVSEMYRVRPWPPLLGMMSEPVSFDAPIGV